MMNRFRKFLMALPGIAALSRLPVRKRAWSLAGAGFCWLLLLWGALQLGKCRSSFSDSFCGPWGCTAPLEAVLAYHLLWVLFVAPLLLMINFGQPIRWRRTAALCLLIAVAGISFYGWQEFFWEEVTGKTWQASYFWKRWRNQIIGSTDYPIIPSAILFFCCLVLSILSKREMKDKTFDEPERLVQSLDVSPETTRPSSI